MTVYLSSTVSEPQDTGFDTLLTTDITKSSAMQRAGRAGREGHGYCFRLYTEDAFNSMIMSAEPEVLRSSLTAVYLQLKVIGQDLDTMPFMDRPDQESGVFYSRQYETCLTSSISWFSFADTLAPRRY